MRPTGETIVIVGMHIEDCANELRRLGVPPPALARGGRVHLVSREHMDRARGLQDYLWCTTPELEVPDIVVAQMSAQRGQRVGFHEAVARHLAWRIWHEQ